MRPSVLDRTISRTRRRVFGWTGRGACTSGSGVTRVSGRVPRSSPSASFGFGTYRFRLDSPVDDIDPNAVVGLFTWSDRPDFNHREIDIEISRWGEPGNPNAQFV